MKRMYAIQTVEFAKSIEIDGESASCWRVPEYLRSHDLIVAAINRRASKVSHKYGIEVPTSLGHAIDLDRGNKDKLWQDAINKEMRNVCVSFEILDDN